MNRVAANLRQPFLIPLFGLPVFGLLASCATSHHVLALSPVNESAMQAGALTARLESLNVYTPLGAGVITTMKVTMPDGEVLTGPFDHGGGGGPGFGSIYDAAYGPEGAANKSVVHRGSASLVGDGSTSMQCEFYTKTFSGRMTGACRTSRGELYGFHD